MQFLHDEQGRQQTAHIAAHIKRPLHAADELPAGTRFGAVVKFGILPEPRENVRRFEGRAQGGESGVGLCFVPAAQAVGNKAEQGRAVEGMKRARRGGQDGERGEKIEAQLVARRVGAFFLLSIIGPVTEELGYRAGLFSFLSRFGKPAAYLISILIFAFIHFDFGCFKEGGTAIAIEMVNLPSYLFGGIALSICYDKFGIEGSTTAHILYNAASFFTQLI